MRRARSGFTLVEMTVVLVIISILAAVVAPAMLRMLEPAADKGDAMPVAALFRSARKEAIERGVIVSLTLDAAGGRYRADSSSARGTGLLREGDIALRDGVSLETDSLRVRFTFRPDGSVFGDTVTVHGATGSSVVALDRWTGEIFVHAR